jgi:hypothetical protein
MPTFVSYARPDATFALRLASDLRHAAIDVWIDQLDIRPGQTWDQAVEQALQRSDSVLVILSPRAVASRSVMDEVSYALEENKWTIPVLLEACELPFRLRRLQHTDFSTDYDSALTRLLAAFSAASAAAQPVQPLATPEAPLDNADPSGVVDGSDAHTSGAGRKRPERGYWASRRPRLITGLWVGIVGGLFSAILQILIFANDSRFGASGSAQLLTTVLLGGGIAGVVWAVAGFVAGPHRVPLLGSLAMSFIVLASCIGAFGTYQDVMSAAVMFGWPVGGIIGAWIGSKV